MMQSCIMKSMVRENRLVLLHGNGGSIKEFYKQIPKPFGFL
ncbi:hypothetical protein ACFP3I_25220 [Chryseobacterium arachidis]